MMSMCPSCFELYSEIWSRHCCKCRYKTVSVSVELIIVVKLLIERGFKVYSANCNTYNNQNDINKITQIDIHFSETYPEAIFHELPPDWKVYQFNNVKNNKILEPKLTGISCLCEHLPNECDEKNIAFDKELTISNFEVWLEEKDPESYRAILILAGCI